MNTSSMKINIDLPALVGYVSLLFGAYAHDSYWFGAGIVMIGMSVLYTTVRKG